MCDDTSNRGAQQSERFNAIFLADRIILTQGVSRFLFNSSRQSTQQF